MSPTCAQAAVLPPEVVARLVAVAEAARRFLEVEDMVMRCEDCAEFGAPCDFHQWRYVNDRRDLAAALDAVGGTELLGADVPTVTPGSETAGVGDVPMPAWSVRSPGSASGGPNQRCRALGVTALLRTRSLIAPKSDSSGGSSGARSAEGSDRS